MNEFCEDCWQPIRSEIDQNSLRETGLCRRCADGYCYPDPEEETSQPNPTPYAHLSYAYHS